MLDFASETPFACEIDWRGEELGTPEVKVGADREADLDMAVEIVINAKTQCPGVCNAIETVLIHTEVATLFLQKLARRLAAKKVQLRADDSAFTQLSSLHYASLQQASEADWSTEFLDLVLAVGVVDSAVNANEHIERFGRTIVIAS